MVQVNFYSVFVDEKTVAPQSAERDKRLKAQQDAIDEKYKNDPERRAEESDKLEAANPLPPLPISKLIDHIDHIVKVAGVDHVGIGADFDGANDMPEGAQDVSMLPNITYELLKRGYSERDIRKILGENTLRVMAEAERRGAQIRWKTLVGTVVWTGLTRNDDRINKIEILSILKNLVNPV